MKGYRTCRSSRLLVNVGIQERIAELMAQAKMLTFIDIEKRISWAGIGRIGHYKKVQ